MILSLPPDLWHPQGSFHRPGRRSDAEAGGFGRPALRPLQVHAEAVLQGAAPLPAGLPQKPGTSGSLAWGPRGSSEDREAASDWELNRIDSARQSGKIHAGTLGGCCGDALHQDDPAALERAFTSISGSAEIIHVKFDNGREPI